MILVMFDIDGTLTHSCEYDARLFVQAVFDITGKHVSGNWTDYPQVTDSAVINSILAGMDDCTQLENLIRSRFSELIEQHISLLDPKKHMLLGANQFISKLISIPTIDISFATGGWAKTAKMKVRSIGVEPDNFAFASADDHTHRTEIMKIALEKTQKSYQTIYYFGDGMWDQKACQQLGFEFIAVGNKTEHHQVIQDFTNLALIAEYIPQLR